jgi:hypothetical protein
MRLFEELVLEPAAAAHGADAMVRVLDVSVGDTTSSSHSQRPLEPVKPGIPTGNAAYRVAIRHADRVSISPSAPSIVRASLGLGAERERRYDACICCYALHHMPRAASLLSELRQSLLLAHGRLLLIESLPGETTQPLLSCVVFGAQSVAQGLPFQMHHRRSRAEWRTLLGDAGFRVDEEREIAPSLAVPYMRVAFLARPRPN